MLKEFTNLWKALRVLSSRENRELKHYILECLQMKMKAGNPSGTQELQHSFIATISALCGILVLKPLSLFSGVCFIIYIGGFAFCNLIGICRILMYVDL